MAHTGRPSMFVGTAGWSIPRLQQAHFPEGGSHLERYAAVFLCAEIDTSFYRPHRRATYARWAASTGEAFRFSVKAPKAVTHTPDFAEADVDAFVSEVAGLGDKLGAVLLQLPPKRSFDADDARRLLSAFRKRTATSLVLEPRHRSWFCDEAQDLLLDLNIARVAADPPRAEGADRPGGSAGLVYLRLHGSPVIYRSSYDDGRLDGVAAMLRSAANSGAETWCIFDNTASYAATGDALALRETLDSA